MRSIVSRSRSVRYAIAFAALFVLHAHAQVDDTIRAAASAANHFIATPEGWEHPKTPWGEPDIRATLNMMQAAGVALERCASTHRFGAPPCDMDKAWLTEEEYAQRVAAAAERGDRSRRLLEEGDVGGAFQAGIMDPSMPQRQTNLIVDPPSGLLPELTPEGKRRAREMRSDWALPGEDLTFDSARDFDSWDRCITRGNRFPISERMKTTERITRLNDDWWLYEITTEDPVVLTRPFTVRYPMRDDPEYWWSEYACHEDNTIVRNYVETSRYERANPAPEPQQPPVEISPDLADTLVGTNLGAIDKPLRSFTIGQREMRFELPNTQPWSFAGEITADGTIVGVVSSSQGGLPVTFRRTTASRALPVRSR